MEQTYHPLSLATLETINRVARAAHLWIRHKQLAQTFVPVGVAAQAHPQLAAGIISGLCDALLLDDQVALLSAYAYALLDGEDEQALNTARALLKQHRTAAEAVAFRDGTMAALDIIAVVQFELPVDALSVGLHPERAGSGNASSRNEH